MFLFNKYLEKKAVHAFPKGILPKVNAIARLKLVLTYYDVTEQHVWYKAMGTQSRKREDVERMKIIRKEEE